MRKYSIRAYDEAAHTGYIRHIYIRFGAESGQILVCITANTQQLPKKKQLVQTLLAAEPGITTIVFSPNTKKGNTVLGTEFLPLYGSGTITDTLCGLHVPAVCTRRFIRSTTHRLSGCTKRPLHWPDLTGT